MQRNRVENRRGPSFLGRLVLAWLLLLIPAGVEAVDDDPYRDTALSLTQELVRFFPPAEGFVVSLPAGEVYIDLTEEQLMRTGMELLVYREGDDIVHPVSGDVLGKYEEKIGYLILTGVHDKYSVGTPVEGSGEIEPGDRVRISARPLQTLLLLSTESPSLDAGRLARELMQTTEQSGRFRLRDEPEWLPRLKENDLNIDDVLSQAQGLRQLGETAKADLLLVVTPSAEESAVTLEALSLWTGRVLAEFRRDWSPPAAATSAEARSSSPFRPFPGREKEELKREYVTKDLSTAALTLVTGDFTGGGGLEVMITDGQRLTLYGWEEGGLLWKWESERNRGWRILNYDAVDLDDDGKDEILLVKVRKGQLLTEALSWDQGEWHGLGRIEGVYLRSVPTGEGEGMILGQRSGVNTVFSGPVRQYEWTADAFRTGDGITLPAGVDLFGMTLIDTDGDGELEILHLDDAGRLRLLSMEGERLFQGRERLGGYPARITAEELFGSTLVDGGFTQGLFREGITDEATNKDVDLDIRTAFQGRILTARDEDGTLFAIIPQNFSGPGVVLPDLRQLDKGKVFLLEWVDGRFEELNRSREQGGFVSDVAWGDADGDGRKEIFMAVNRPTGVLLRKEGTIVLWNYH